MIHLLEQGKVIINVDETFLKDSDFRRRKWRKRHTTNSTQLRAVKPRINIVAALDSRGNIYLSLMQCNLDTNVMKLYLTQLAKSLDQDRPGWRLDSVLLLDGAKPHTSRSTMAHL